ncbi:putative tail fiber protein [Acinetobacter phage Scuro]|nr:putative tail fiber protein [Acinetobacter phage Scuro]
MAIIPSDQYPGKTAGPTANYPLGEPRNITTPGDGTGTPWEAALVKDLFGFQQALLSAANITASGDPDTALVSQYLEAIQTLIETAATTLKNRMIGIDQTWKNVTSARTSGVTYTNGTPKPIQVMINANFNSGSFVVQGVSIPIYDGGEWGFVSAIIPPGATYGANVSGGTITSWAELR